MGRHDAQPAAIESPPLPSFATTVVRCVAFVCAFALYVLVRGMQDSQIVANGVVLLAVVVDALLALAAGNRGWTYVRELAATLATWGAVVLIAPGVGPGDLVMAENPGIAWAIWAAALIAIILFPRVQALLVWGLASIGATVFMLGESQWLVDLNAPRLIGLLAFVLSASSIGALGYYGRSVMTQRLKWRALISRLALLVGAIGLATLVASAAVTQAGRSMALDQAIIQASTRDHYLLLAAETLSVQFPESVLASPTPALERELTRLGLMGDVGLSVFDLKARTNTIAVRRVSRPVGQLPTAVANAFPNQSDVNVFERVTLGESDAQAIAAEAAAITGTSAETEADSGLAPIVPRAYQLGFDNEVDRAEASSLADTSSLIPGAAVLTGERFRLVASEAPAEPDQRNSAGADEVSWQRSTSLAPWLFFAFALPCALGLIALDRRDLTRAKLIAAEERARLNRDAHDRVYNRLTALANQLAASQPASTPSPTPAEEIHRTVSDLQSILGDGATQPVGQASDAAGSLLADICEDQGRVWSMDIVLEGAEDLLGVDPRVGWELACVAEEALTNAGKHGRATHALVTVNRTARALMLTIADNGSGIQTPMREGLPEGASGTRGITERAASLGGTLEIGTGPGGTTVVATIPLAS
jgi:signal transduction histidine kinase